MHIMVDIGHPGDVHVFYQPIRRWQAAGHRVTIVASQKDVALGLLDSYGLPYHVVAVRRPGVWNLAYLLIMRTLRIAVLAWRRGRPDIFVSVCSPTLAIASKLAFRPHVVFDDSEFGIQQIALYKPFTEAIVTPRQFGRELGRKQIRYAGFKELAYLHPSVFRPDPQVLRDLGFDPVAPLYVVRLVEWMAAHDFGEHGFSQAAQEKLLARLAGMGRVIVSYEGKPPHELGRPDRPLPVEAMLHFLAHARLLVTEGLTMATEAALLGTPALVMNTLKSGNMRLLESYGLAAIFDDETPALAQLEAWLADPDLKPKAEQALQTLLADSTDVVALISDFVLEFGAGKKPQMPRVGA
jgi:predicted glycosyltransferase